MVECSVRTGAVMLPLCINACALCVQASLPSPLSLLYLCRWWCISRRQTNTTYCSELREKEQRSFALLALKCVNVARLEHDLAIYRRRATLLLNVRDRIEQTKVWFYAKKKMGECFLGSITNYSDDQVNVGFRRGSYACLSIIGVSFRNWRMYYVQGQKFVACP